MSDIKFFYSNKLTTGTLRNGTGGGAPATEEDPSFPMANLLDDDTLSPWKSSATPADPLQVDISITSSTLRAIGITGFSGGSGISFGVYYSTSSTYPPGSWLSLVGATSLNKATTLVEVNQSGVRQLRFEFNSLPGAIRIGKLFAGASTVNLGHEGGPGTSELVDKWRSVIETEAGGLLVSSLASDSARFRLELPFMNSTDRSNIKTVAALSGPVMMLWSDGVAWEVFIEDDQIVLERIFSPPTLDRTQLKLRALR